MLDDWFQSERRAGRYESIRGDLRSVVTAAESEGIPADLIVAKLGEGAAKRIDPARLLDAIFRELDRYLTAAAIFDETPLKPTEDSFRRMGIYLAGGMDSGMIMAIAETVQFDPGRTYGICDAIVEIIAMYSLEQETSAELGLAVASSTLDDKAIEALPAVFLKARIARIPAHEAVSIAITAFERGDGIASIDREIDQKGNRR